MSWNSAEIEGSGKFRPSNKTEKEEKNRQPREGLGKKGHGKEFGVQAQGPEFKPPDPHKNPDVVVSLCQSQGFYN